MEKKTTEKPSSRICDLELSDFLAPARPMPLLNTREKQVVSLAKSGASLVHLVRVSGFHPRKILDLTGRTDSNIQDFNAAASEFNRLDNLYDSEI